MSGTPCPWRVYIEGRDSTSGGEFMMTGHDANHGEDFEIWSKS